MCDSSGRWSRSTEASTTHHIRQHQGYLNAHTLRILVHAPSTYNTHSRTVKLPCPYAQHSCAATSIWCFLVRIEVRSIKELLVEYILANGLPPTRASAEEGGYWCRVAEYVCSSAVRKPSRSLVRAVAGTWYSNTHGVKEACLLALGNSTAAPKTSVSTTIHVPYTAFFMKFNSKQRTKHRSIKWWESQVYGAWGDIIKDEVNSTWNM